jgi:hypothetical protein
VPEIVIPQLENADRNPEAKASTEGHDVDAKAFPTQLIAVIVVAGTSVPPN